MMTYNKNRKKENVYFSKNLFHFTVFKSCLWETHICFP
mgnify:FL=1